jgi:excisionase family DNA binding protein
MKVRSARAEPYCSKRSEADAEKTPAQEFKRTKERKPLVFMVFAAEPWRAGGATFDFRSEMSADGGNTASVTRAYFGRVEVSRLFGVSVSTVTRWARLGLLKAVRTPGGHYRFPADETLRAVERAGAGELTRLD